MLAFMFSFYTFSHNNIIIFSRCDFIIHCLICKRKIKLDDTENLFIITLGNLNNGTFYGSKKKYFHVSCRIEDNSE